MKSFDTGYQTQPRVYTLIRTGPYPYNETSSVNYAVRRDFATSGAVVQGNFTDPNSWSYDVQYANLLRGRTTKYIEYTSGSLSTTRESVKYEGAIVDSTAHMMFPVTAVPADVVNNALSKLNDKTRGNIDLSIDLLQAGQTKKMFSQANIAELFTRNFKGITQLIAGVSAIRLQYVYGIKPTLQTIYDCADRNLNMILNYIESFKARSAQPVVSSSETVPVVLYGNVPVKMRRSGIVFCEFGIKLKTRGNDPSYWSSLNPASIAWEMMPYSFVVDWCLDVGSYLRNFETSLLFANSFVSGYRTEGVMYDTSGSCTSSKVLKPYGQIDTYTVEATCSGRIRKLTRSKLLTYPAPRLPTFKADLGPQRLFNAAALIGVYLKRK